MIKFIAKERDDILEKKGELVTWANVQWEDIKEDDIHEYPIQKINLEVTAGDIAILTVTRYGQVTYENGTKSAAPKSTGGDKNCPTFTEEYLVYDIGDIEIPVSDSTPPCCKNGNHGCITINPKKEDDNESN